MDENMVSKLITSLICPKLEYAATVWSPGTRKHIRKLERIQRAATKIPLSLRELSYEERLERLGLTTLEQRRERGDLIMVYRIMKGVVHLDREDLINWDIRDTRGHGKKLKKSTCRRDIKKHSFPQRCIETWNGLDKEIVNAETIHDFKEKLDAYRYGDGTVQA